MRALFMQMRLDIDARVHTYAHGNCQWRCETIHERERRARRSRRNNSTTITRSRRERLVNSDGKNVVRDASDTCKSKRWSRFSVISVIVRYDTVRYGFAARPPRSLDRPKVASTRRFNENSLVICGNEKSTNLLIRTDFSNLRIMESLLGQLPDESRSRNTVISIMSPLHGKCWHAFPIGLQRVNVVV